jgi:xylan 1,4-beta-xylosidase
MIWRALATLALLVAAPAIADPGSTAVFAYVSYLGGDAATDNVPPKRDAYRNPILPGFHPDPSIVRVGSDYYLVNSTFAYFPGLPVFHSRDLVNWTQIGNAVDRTNMVDFSGLGVSRGLFAPTLRHRDGIFYIVNTCIDCGGNFIITAKNPAGPWSKPRFLPPVDGIDPDLFFDDDGRAWIANNGPPIGTPRYDGHRALWIQELDLETMTMTGPRTLIVDGGVLPQDKPIWTEGPHLSRRDGWVYLIAAEGGTAGNHSETVYRSRAVTGPYEPGPVNPILTQRDLDPARPNPVYATGHADFVQTPRGDWWAVFLGTRPFDASLSGMGRETFLLPVTWPKGEWPQILAAKTAVPLAARRPALPVTPKIDRSRWRDAFTAPALSPEWMMLRTPKVRWMRTAPNALTLTAQAVALGSTGNPSFVARRQAHSQATIETRLRYRPARDGDRAGLAVFSDEQHFYFVGAALIDGAAPDCGAPRERR